MTYTAQRGARWVAATGAALALVACGGDTDSAPEEPEGTTDSAPQYFTGDQYLGETVTITAEVTDVYFAGGLGVDAGKWGDETVLALSEDEADTIEEGDTVRVTGKVETFTYEEYAVSHGLANEGMYERYNGERFLDAGAIEVVANP